MHHPLPYIFMIQRKAVKLKIHAGKYSAINAARTMAAAVVLRCHSWLCITALPLETRARVKDLPFRCSTSFAQSSNKFLSIMKRNKQTVCSLAVSPLAPNKGQDFQQQQHGFDSHFYRGQHQLPHQIYVCAQGQFKMSYFGKHGGTICSCPA